MSMLRQLIGTPLGVGLTLGVAAYMEVQGDALFQRGLFQANGALRIGLFLAGAVTLAAYSLFLNSARLDFGKLLGIYVVWFFLVAQVVARFQFHQSPSKPVVVGGAFIVAGGIIMTIWKA